jgi:hypothetical protein
MKRGLRLVLLAAVAVAVILAGTPYVVYWVALATLPSYPGPPEALPSVGPAELEVWAEYSGHGPVALRPINPVRFVVLLMNCEDVGRCYDSYPGLRVAGRVAQNYLRRQKPTRVIWFHFRSTSLSIWLTQHWTAEQLLAQLVRDHHGLSSNDALQRTHSPVTPLAERRKRRARRRAAERGRWADKRRGCA